MKVFVIFLVLIGFVGFAHADEPKPFAGEFDKPPIEIWDESRAILDGTITQKDQSEEWTNYDITINEMFKGTTKAKSITGFTPRNVDWILNEGDRALIYLKSGNEISKYSVKSSNSCSPRELIQISPVLPNDNSIVRGAPILPWDWKDPCVPYYFTYDPDFWNYMEYKPPLRQYADHNLPIHMQRCGNDDHVSVIPKSHPYHIACVTESTKIKLIERGWTSTNDNHNTDGSSNGHWKLKSEAFVAIPSHELTPIDTVNVDGRYSATAILTKPHGMSDQYPSLGYVMYVQILDPNGDTIAGSWHHGTIQTNQTISAGTYWSPKDVGKYTIEVFVWQSFTGTPHADVSRHTVKVTE